MSELRSYEGESPYLFVSYAHADGELVHPELERFHQEGVRLWFDRGITPAADWRVTISRKVVNSAGVLVYLSPAAVTSRWVAREVFLADDYGKTIIPVYLEPLILSPELHLVLGPLQAIPQPEVDSGESLYAIRRCLEKTSHTPDVPQFLYGTPAKQGLASRHGAGLA